MKKLAMMILLVSVLLMSVVPTAMAVTISSGDYVYLTAYNSNGGGGIMTYAVSDNPNFTGASYYDTFCIQDNVYVWPHTWYPVASVSTNVGYISPNAPAGAGPLNLAVDYLFSQFASGAYDDEFYTAGSITDQKLNQYDFQRVLWSLQGSGSPFTSNGTPWAEDLSEYNSLPSMHHSWGTQVINIVSAYSNGQFSGFDIQNQLYYDNTHPYDPVPEPATMLLLGFGLIGLAGIRRKCKF